MGLNEPPTTRHGSTPAQPARPDQPARPAPPAQPARPAKRARAGRTDREVRLDIDELVLDGFGPELDRDLVSASFQAELTRLVERRGVPLAAGEGDRVLDALAGLPPLPSHASPARIGEALARAVHAGLSGQGHTPRARRGSWDGPRPAREAYGRRR